MKNISHTHESCYTVDTLLQKIKQHISFRNDRMPRCIMEMKIINIQRAEFKNTTKIKVKNDEAG